MKSIPKILWEPNSEMLTNSNMIHYMNDIEKEYQIQVKTYEDLYSWSVTHIEDFWESIYNYFKVIDHGKPNNVLFNHNMPGTEWFQGSKLNYAEHIFAHKSAKFPAIIYNNERERNIPISWQELEEKVAALAECYKSAGIKKGDTIVGFLPNIPEAVIAFLAAASLGAIWSSCSPDFGVDSVVERFQQIKPKAFIFADGYTYNGKAYSKIETALAIQEKLPELLLSIGIGFLDKHENSIDLPGVVSWSRASSNEVNELTYEALPFGHPIWVLYSSGTTGKPKAITHSHGGVLLEHLKYISLQNDVRLGERFFWFSTTGWMMWNFSVASMLVGATLVLYEGSPAYPDLNAMWSLANENKINHFGTSAPFLIACMKKGIEPSRNFNLEHIRSIGSTGSPLPPEAFAYVYQKIKSDVWLCSMSGGTDVCTAFIGGCPIVPVYQGEIQCRALGCALEAWNDNSEPTTNEVGEMIIKSPMPSMPIYFWNDPDYKRYTESYFEMFPGVWRHGDWIIVTERGSLVILGRSDATLNRQGIRIGTAEIYRVVDKIAEIKDSLIVNIENADGSHYMPLFVVLNQGKELTDLVEIKIKKALRSTYSPRHVPDEIIAVPDIPYTISGKKLEAPVKKILIGMPLSKAANIGAVRNPESLDFFMNLRSNISH